MERLIDGESNGDCDEVMCANNDDNV